MKSLLLCQSLALVLIGTSVTLAQGPPPAPAAPTTLFNFFGIPQGFQKVRDANVNKRGNNPQRERKPPLKRIGDPANLFSENPAIKKAAEVKTQEDLAPQKVKAIKYLASIGCGCYNKDGGITKALLAAMEDCTEEVRLAAVNAIMDAACADACVYCKQKTCCTPEIAKQLERMAYEQDAKGCWFEPSARVRAAAAQAMNSCSQKLENRETGDGKEVPRPEAPTPEVPAIDGDTRTRIPQPPVSRQQSAGRTTQVERTPPVDAAPMIDFSTARQVATSTYRKPAPTATARVASNEVRRASVEQTPTSERRSVVVSRSESTESNATIEPASKQVVPTKVVTAKRIVTKKKASVESSPAERAETLESPPTVAGQATAPAAASSDLVRFLPAAGTTAAPLSSPTKVSAVGSAEAQSKPAAVRHTESGVRVSEASTGERRY